MRPIYILLTKTDTVLSRAIGLVTRDPYTHAAISLDKELTELYSFGRKTKRNPLNAGFVKEKIIGSIYEENLECNCALFETMITEEQYKKLQRELKRMRRTQGMYRYNLLGFVNFFIESEIKRSNKFFCSEFVSEMLRRIDVLPDEYSPSKTKPSDFTKMDIFENIYSGQLGNLIA